MFDTLSANLYEVNPIKLGYLNSNRDFIGDFTSTESEDYFTFQDELSSVVDFSINFDTVNILTDRRLKFSNNKTQSTLAVYEEGLPDTLCLENKDNCANYWLTIPIEGYTDVSGVCVGSTNIVPLKNNFSEEHHTLCTPCYRDYKSLNFGESGMDNLKPEILFTTKVESKLFDKSFDTFTFRIPDWSESLFANDLDLMCFGAIASDCPLFSDNIEWRNYTNGELTNTWLSGDGCDGVWVDRHYENDTFYDITPSEIVFLSGVDYTYHRPSKEEQETIREAIINSEEIIFSLDCVSGDTIVDGSPNNIDGKFV